MLKFHDDYTTTLNNLDDLFTIIYIIIDDLYQKYAPVQVKSRKNVAESKISDSEIIIISFVGKILGIDTENVWQSFVKKNDQLLTIIAESNRTGRTFRQPD